LSQEDGRLDKPLLAYQLIEVVDHLNLKTHELIEPILTMRNCPENIRNEAASLLIRVDLLTEQTVEQPDLNLLYEGIADVRERLVNLMSMVPT